MKFRNETTSRASLLLFAAPRDLPPFAHTALHIDDIARRDRAIPQYISDDSLRRALAAIAPEPRAQHTEQERQAQQTQVARSVQWMQQHLRRSVDAALYTPWILDCDTTIKVLYGRQQAGVVVSYNPHKPGRPSHAIHTYWIGNLRMVLDAALEAGDCTACSPFVAKEGRDWPLPGRARTGRMNAAETGGVALRAASVGRLTSKAVCLTLALP